LTEFKKVDIAITAFQKMKSSHLVIIGEGELKKNFIERTKEDKNIHIV
jgi:hypothetical protein